VRTVLDKTAPGAVPQETERTTYFIQPEKGIHRKELLNIASNRTSVEIQQPSVTGADRKWSEQRRIILDIPRKQAFVGSTAVPWSAPIATNQPIPTGITPDGVTVDHGPIVPIGTKTIGGLVLNGVRFINHFSGATNFTHIIELWSYQPKPYTPSILMETRASGEWGFDEEQIQQVTTQQVSPAIFEVPRDFTTVQLTK
jgi:hypothetical protein